MTKPNEKLVEFPLPSFRAVWTDVLREGARRLLATVIEAEVADYVAAREAVVDAPGHRRVVRTGYLPERPIHTPLGDIRVQQPRVRDRRPGEERETFRSAILPPYLRRTAQPRSAVSVAVSQGRQHGRLRGDAPGVVGAGGPRAIPDHDHAPEDRLGTGVCDMGEAVVGRSPLYLRLGGRRVLQRAARGHGQQTPVHSGADGRHPETGRKSSSPSPMATARASSRGVSSCWMSRTGGSRSIHSSPRATAGSASGPRCARSSRRPGNSAAGSTRRRTC